MGESTCRSCGASVIFVPSAKTRRPMILDAKPEKRVLVEEPPVGWDIPEWTERRARVVDVHTDHHVTCPDAKAWQGRTRGRPPVRSIAQGVLE